MFRERLKSLNIYRTKGFLAVAGVFLVLLLVCLWNLIAPKDRYVYEGGYSFEQGVAAENMVLYEGIALSPGVYYVELAYETDTDLSGICTVQDGTVFAGGLKTNGEHLYAGLNRTGFHMWLYEGTESLQVLASYGGNGSLRTADLRITETGLLWSMLLTVLLFGAAVLLCVYTYYHYQKQYPVAQEKRTVFLGVMLIAFAASLPYLLGWNISGADFTYHLQRIEGVKDGLLSGQFPIRLEPEWVYGHGYANAIFYCNGLLLFPGILRLLGFTVTASYNLYGIALTVATAWIAYYCFSRIFRDYRIGLCLCGLYTLSLFRIYKLVSVGAVGEGSAFTFMPLVFYGLYLAFTQAPGAKADKRAWIPIAFGYAGLMQTHVLTCEITAFLTVLTCLAGIRRVLRKEVFVTLAKGALGAVALSAWYLIPFLDYYLTQNVHIKFVSARTIQERGLLPLQLITHFWRGNETEGVMSELNAMALGPVLAAALLVFLILWISGRFKSADVDKQGLETAGKWSAVLAALLLVMSLRAFPWDAIQNSHPVLASLVSSLQFPNRFLGWGTLLCVVLFGHCLWYFKAHKKELYGAGVVLALIGITTSGMYMQDYIMTYQNGYELYNEEGMGFGYISGAEYLLEGTDQELLTFQSYVASEGVSVTDYRKEYLQVSMECVNESAEAGYVDLPMLFYRDYRAVDSRTKERMDVCPGANNLLRVILPAGSAATVKVEFVSPFYWRLAECVSIFALAGVIASGLRARRKVQDSEESIRRIAS